MSVRLLESAGRLVPLNVRVRDLNGSGDWPRGWQFHASRTRNQHFRNSMMLPAMQLTLRRRLRRPLRFCHGRCGPAPGCGTQVDRLCGSLAREPSNKRGSAFSHVRPPKGRWRQNNGSCTPRCPECAQMTAAI